MHPDIYQRVIEGGHSIGNHTYNHLNGWQSENLPYFHDVRNCAHVVHSSLFRPPFGRLKPAQIQFYKDIIASSWWDVTVVILIRNYEGQCARNVIENATEGSIIVFHDSLKAKKNLTYALTSVLEHFSALGYTFESLSQHSSGDLQKAATFNLE